MALSRTKTPLFRLLVFVSCALIAAPALLIPSAAEAQPRQGRGAGHGGGWSGHPGGGHGGGGHGWRGMRGRFEPGRVVIPRNAFYGRPTVPRAWRGPHAPVYRARYAPYGRPAYARPVYRPVAYSRPSVGYRYPNHGYGYRNAGYRQAAYGYPVRGYGYPGYSYPAYSYGYQGYGYPAYGSYGGYDNGGAAVAGLIGGLALGMIANASVRPAVRRASTRCFYERRRVTNRSGQAVVRRVRSCY